MTTDIPDDVVERAWHDLCEKSDRTSPVEYPDMALITLDELRAALDAAVKAQKEIYTRDEKPTPPRAAERVREKMIEELRDAIESARTCGRSGRSMIGLHLAEPQHRHSFKTVRAIVLAVMQELPEDMTVREICAELGNANSQFDDQA